MGEALLFQPPFGFEKIQALGEEFTEEEIEKYVQHPRMYLGLNENICLIINKDIQENHEHMNLFATKLLQQFGITDTSIYGLAIAIRYDEMSNDMKVGEE